MTPRGGALTLQTLLAVFVQYVKKSGAQAGIFFSFKPRRETSKLKKNHEIQYKEKYFLAQKAQK